ncbi:MAG: hypothetical protein QM723_21535 [Myxococcaceae bacterium]
MSIEISIFQPERRQPQPPVDRQQRFAEQLGQPPLARVLEQQQLKLPVARVHEADRERGVGLTLGEHVRHPAAVDPNLHLRLQRRVPAQRQRLLLRQLRRVVEAERVTAAPQEHHRQPA